MSPLLIPILGICCGLLAIFAGAIFRPWMKLKERQMELDAENIAEKAAQYAADKGRLEERVAVSGAHRDRPGLQPCQRNRGFAQPASGCPPFA